MAAAVKRLLGVLSLGAALPLAVAETLTHVTHVSDLWHVIDGLLIGSAVSFNLKVDRTND